MKAKKVPAVPKPRAVSVTETNLRKSAARVLGQRLVSTEVHYIQRTLGASATQEEMDASVIAVRKLPWATIVVPD